MYDQHGKRIPRIVAKYVGGVARCCGILQKLDNLDELFEGDEEESADEVDDMLLDSDNHGRGGYIDDEDELGIPPPRRPPRRRFPGLRYEAYPHAFLPNCGQWQARGVISSFDKLLTPISEKTSKHGRGDDIVSAVSSQMYSTFTHRTRESTRMHIAQRGLLTATVAGAWATTPKGSTTFRNLYTQSNFSLPHLRLESQVKNVTDTYLRFENVLRIHCDRMRPESLTGPGFYQDVIRPILNAYYNTNVVDSIRSRCLVLHPEVSEATVFSA